MSAALAFIAALAIGSPALHIVTSSVAEDFERALLIERPALLLTPRDQADLSAHLEREPDAFVLRIEDANLDRLRLMRSIPVAGEREAALRVAVLLTLATLDRDTLVVETSTPAVAVSIPSKTRSRDKDLVSTFSLHILAGSGIWLDQPAPQPSVAVGFLGRWAWLRAGLELSVHGVLCCDRKNDVVVSSWTEFGIGALVGATFFDTPDLRLAADLGAGLLGVVGQSAPADGVFASAGLPASVDHVGLSVLGALEAEVMVASSLAFVGRAGLRLNLTPQTIQLPEAFQGVGESLESPWGGPFLYAGLRFFFF